MNETYDWLYAHYALPLMQVKKDADEIKQTIIAHCGSNDQLYLIDQMNTLCMLWGTDAFSVGLQLGLRLMAGQRVDGLTVE